MFRIQSLGSQVTMFRHHDWLVHDAELLSRYDE